MLRAQECFLNILFGLNNTFEGLCKGRKYILYLKMFVRGGACFLFDTLFYCQTIIYFGQLIVELVRVVCIACK